MVAAKAFAEKHRKQIKMALYILFAFSSVLAGAFLCALQGDALWNIYLPNSQWNDEVIYYRQVESILHSGVPQGYFGYNEVPPAHLTFASWSPVLLLPYVLWGLVFGWNLFSPILCNLCMLVAASALFLYLARPGLMQTAGLFLFTQCLIICNRYSISGQSEALFYSLTFIIAGCICYLQKYPASRWVFWGSVVLSFAATLMRPYLLLFFLCPVLAALAQKRYKALITVAAAAVLSVAAYGWIAANLVAPYPNQIDLSILEVLKQEGLLAALGQLFKTLWQSVKDIGVWFTQVRTYIEGCVYILFFAQLILLAISVVRDIRAKGWKSCLPQLFSAGAGVGVLGCILLFYSVPVGSRHLLLCVLLMGVVLCMVGRPAFWLSQSALAFVLFGVVSFAGDRFTNDIPFRTPQALEKAADCTQQFEAAMQPVTPDARWENTVLVVAFDADEKDGHGLYGDWQSAYFLPAGYSVNFWVSNEFDAQMIKSRYILVAPGSWTEARLAEAGAAELVRTGSLVLFARPE